MTATQLIARGSLGAQLVRAPDVLKSSAPISNSGNTAVWTPAAGKRFRLLRYCIEVTIDASRAAGGLILAMILQDSATDMGLSHSAYIPAASLTTTPGVGYSTGWVDLGGIGILSGATDNVLNLNMSFALTNGKVRVRAAGNEE